MKPLDPVAIHDKLAAVCDFGPQGCLALKQKHSGLDPVVAKAKKLPVGTTVLVCDASGAPWNPSQKPLDPVERPGCDGFHISASDAKCESYAYTLSGRLSIVGQHARLLAADGQVLAQTTVQAKSKSKG